MALAAACALEARATARALGPWALLACLLGTGAAWLQEPRFLRSYGIELLWGGALAILWLLLPLLGLAWCLGRTGHGWSVSARAPLVAVLSGGVGLLAYMTVTCLFTASCVLILGAVGGDWGTGARLLPWAAHWVAAALPMAFLAQAIANVGASPSVTAVLWLGAAAAVSGLAPASLDTLPSTSVLIASVMSTLGSILAATFLVRARR